ncbi:PKD repeat-containing protein [Pedococcus dokdonensis]|uniref:PKD repeat-containing protein n=1 Tax=Pedococcus dokdonensis TaxID=443156 RepID=A0A1H0S8H0_9MICO|nr:LamG domain-containing protein [Pedococcus dokdonensis]SDP38072.1 PKD repeat-containing protein [Pedococcus dokdonensis]
MHVEQLRGPVRRLVATVTTAALVWFGFIVASPAAMAADAGAQATPPTTVTADALPTWQINGVVWSQVVVGNTVYATGSFTKARPPGVAPGGAGEIDALNIFAYDITTGERVASFNHSLNAQGLAITRSPDGSRVYVGGDFSAVDGVARGKIAAFSTADGSLLPWAGVAGGQVRALAVSSSTVYVGGSFPSAGGQARAALAAFSVSSPVTLSSWAPSAGGVNATVLAMQLAPDGSRVILGGSFETLSGTAAYGMGSVDATTGAVLPWAANTKIRTAGYNGGITSLSTDGTQIFGTGYAFGSGASFEGTFAADPTTGNLNYVNDCLGDHYSSFPLNGVLYSVSHSHDCTVVGSFPDTSPRARWQKVTAEPTTPVGITARTDAYGWDFRGIPYAGILHWFPDFKFGTYTADRQAAWNVTGGGNYVVFGGEFPTVNGKAQQGLVRFALPASSPKAAKPLYSTAMDPIATSTEAGRVKVDFGTVYDWDDATLTYDVYRDNGPTIGAVTAASNFWTLPGLSFTDTGVAPGTVHTYKVRAKDKDGNVQWSLASNSVTVSSTPMPAYVASVRADNPSHLWRLGDAGPGYLDSAGFNGGTSTGVTFGQSGAVSGDSAVRSSGGSSPKLYPTLVDPHPSEVTVEGWIQTSSSSGGRIVGYGNTQSGTSASATNDLVLYVDSGNRIAFAQTGPTGTVRSVRSARTVNDNAWHHVAATAGADGISLYVDGRRVGRDQNPVTMYPFVGYWRLLADQTSGLPNRPSNGALSGSVDEVAVYPTVLSQSRIQAHYLDSGRSQSWSTPPADAYSQAVNAQSPDQFWRLDETSGSSVLDSSASGQDGSVLAGVTWGAAGSPASATNRAATLNGNSGAIVSRETATSPKTYSAEVWFKTNTTRGGRLIGFGNSSSTTLSSASSSDRQICMLNNGRLQFGTSGAVRNLAETTTSYNDNQWHHAVATQGADGMKLYVDGLQVASNAATDAASFVGYWRVGGDRCYGGQTSNYLAGTVDEAAVYATALTAAQVRSHFEAAGGAIPNQSPTASFSSTKDLLDISVNGTGSSDPDGSIASWSWSWGDGTPAGSGATATHTYAAAGTYTVALTVTDDDGATNTTSAPVTVTTNQPPVSSFTTSSTFLALSVNGSGSSDADGTIASYSWNWGDGTAAGSGATATHTYAAAGAYTVALTVTDDRGATTTSSQVISVVEPPNQAPTASFTSTKDLLALSVNGSGSSDPDGTIASYSWNWGDGTAAGSGATATHTYAAAGTYTVELTVTDDDGATNTSSASVTVVANQAPVASFTSSATFLALSVNGSGSSDADGTIASYSWSWGDGTAAGSGATATHTYAAAGTYTVALTVTDDRGATTTTTSSVTVAAQSILAEDHFGRTSTSGWGSAETGGAWTLGGTITRWTVNSGLGKVWLNAGEGSTAALNGVSSTRSDVRVTVTTDKEPTGGGQYISVIGRRVSTTQDYRAKIRFAAGGATAVWLTRNEGATETVLTSITVPGLTYAANDRMQVRLQTFGTSPTTVRVKIWKSGTTEPTAWTLSATDSGTALQAAGSVALYPYLSATVTNGPVTYGVDDLTVTEIP